MKSRNDRLYLYDIVKFSERIALYVESTDEAGFATNFMAQDAIVRNIEVIGEAVKNLSIEIKNEYPKVAWSEISRMRDKIAHHYFRIDLDIVWKTSNADIPLLASQVATILEEIE